MPSPSPSHAELAAVLARLGCAAGASELHGSLVGYLCPGGVPQAEQPLPQRAEALREWCRGLLGGLGLGGLAGNLPLSAEGREILGDFGAIAAARFDYADDDEEDENALAEVLEFVRVGTLLLHAEFAALARGDDPLQ